MTLKEVKKSVPVINVFPRKGLKREVELALMVSWTNFCFRFQQLQFSLANRAMFSLLRKCRQLNLPLDIQLELF